MAYCDVDSFLHRNLYLTVTQRKLNTIFIFGMTYYMEHIVENLFFLAHTYMITRKIWNWLRIATGDTFHLTNDQCEMHNCDF